MRNNCLMISLSDLKIKYASIKPVAKTTENTTAIPRASWKIMRCGQEELMVCFTQCIFLEIGSAFFFIYTHYIKITKLRYINNLFSLIGKIIWNLKIIFRMSTYEELKKSWNCLWYFVSVNIWRGEIYFAHGFAAT